MTPVKTIQTRSNYAPWLSEETKNLQVERNAAQEKAAESDTPENWRLFRSLRNQVTARSRSDKTNWEKKKLVCGELSRACLAGVVVALQLNSLLKARWLLVQLVCLVP